VTILPVLAIAAPAAAIVLFLLGQGVLRGPTLDASVFAQIAEQMRAGDVPYRDMFDHKPPGIYLTEAALGALAPWVDPWFRAWSISVVAAAGTLVLLARRLGPPSRPAATLALLAVAPALGAHAFAQGGGYTESLAVLPATAGFLLATSTRVAPLALRAGLCGVLLALAVATSLHLAPAGLGTLAALVATGARTRGVTAFLLGGSVVGGGVIAWLAAAGALPGAIEQLIDYNRAYTIGPTFDQPVLPATVIVVAAMAAPAVAAAAVRVIGLARGRYAEPIEIGALVWIAAAGVVVALQRQFFGHYVLPLAAPLAILAAPALRLLLDQLSSPGLRRVGAYVMLGASFALPIPFMAVLEPGPVRTDPVAAVAASLSVTIPAGDAIFVWGNEPYVYLLAQRPSAGRFVYLFPLTHPRFTTPALIARHLSDWEEDPPAAIVDASNHPTAVSAHPLLGRWVWEGEPVADHLDPLRAFVRDHYRAADTIKGWTIYVPR